MGISWVNVAELMILEAIWGPDSCDFEGWTTPKCAQLKVLCRRRVDWAHAMKANIQRATWVRRNFRSLYVAFQSSRIWHRSCRLIPSRYFREPSICAAKRSSHSIFLKHTEIIRHDWSLCRSQEMQVLALIKRSLLIILRQTNSRMKILLVRSGLTARGKSRFFFLVGSFSGSRLSTGGWNNEWVKCENEWNKVKQNDYPINPIAKKIVCRYDESKHTHG